MDHGKALFIILTAMVIASSILSVGSLTLINALSTDLFAKTPGAQGEPIFKLRGDDVHLTRERVLYYPRKMFMFYMLCFVMALVYVGTYLGPLQMKEDHGVLVRFISLKNA